MDLSSASDSILLIFLSSHSELLIFFSILCRNSSIRLRSDLNSLLLLLDVPASSVLVVDFVFFSVLEPSLLALESLTPFRFPRRLSPDCFDRFDNLPLRLVDPDNIMFVDFDAFILRGTVAIESSALPSSPRRNLTFWGSALRTWFVWFCAVASQKCDATKRTGTIIAAVDQCGRFLLPLLDGMHSIVAFIWVCPPTS